MKEYILYLLYKAMAYMFYFIGDKIWRIDTDWAYEWYQKAMSWSVNFDEKIGWEIWEDYKDNKGYRK